MKQSPRIAIVYDWIDKWGGVERLLLTLHELYPEAQFYTSYVDYNTATWAKNIPITSSFMQKLPGFIKKSRILSLPFFSLAFESFDFSDYDLVISVTSGFAKSIVTKPSTTHISYILTPPRYLWGEQAGTYKRPLSGIVASWLRKDDWYSSKCPDILLTLSQVVQKRIQTYYNRESTVIYPPFDTTYWEKVSKNASLEKVKETYHIPPQYYLVVSRLEPYKKVEVAVRAFTSLKNEHLIIVGKGTQSRHLKKMASRNITFLENISDEDLSALYMNATALIMPQEEDFGYVALEALYFNCPVIARAAGGALETVIEGKTGVFFDGSVAQLEKTLADFHTLSYNFKKMISMQREKQIELFSKEHFVHALKQIVSRY